MKIFWLQTDNLLHCLKQAVANLAGRFPEVAEVWLFGSLARGEARPGSDVDLLIVLESCPLPFLDRSPYYQPEFCGLGVDILAYTLDELSQMVDQGHPILQEVQKEGICLWQRGEKRLGQVAQE